jgi:hypothetical protein
VTADGLLDLAAKRYLLDGMDWRNYSRRATMNRKWRRFAAIRIGDIPSFVSHFISNLSGSHPVAALCITPT